MVCGALVVNGLMLHRPLRDHGDQADVMIVCGSECRHSELIHVLSSQTAKRSLREALGEALETLPVEK